MFPALVDALARYWLMSMAAAGDVRKNVMYSAVYKGVQSLGAGIV